FKLKTIIAGGRESGRLANRLTQMKVPVLLSLNLPHRTTAALPEADPEPLRVLRERVEAQQTAGKLAKAGVRFGFQSGSLANMSDLLPNAAKTIEAGLSSEDAVRAFTLWPAEILGVSNQLGSIDKGKIANLTITRGDLFDRNSRVAHIFIDGREIDLHPESAGPTGRNTLSGTWTAIINLGADSKTITLNLQQEGDRLRGSIEGTLGSAEIANASSLPEFRFTVPVNIDGQTKEATFSGTASGNELRGTITIEGRAPGSFKATRTSQPN